MGGREDVNGSTSDPGMADLQHDFAGIRVSTPTLSQLLTIICQRLSGGRLSITFINPDYARLAFLDEALRATHQRLRPGARRRQWRPVDGATVRVPGSGAARHGQPRSTIVRCAGRGRRQGLPLRVSPGIAQRAAAHVAAAYPDLEIVGCEHGFWDVQRGHPGRFDAEDTARIIDRINASGTDFLLVSLPTPLQQTWVIENREAIEAPIVMTGGSFLDHVAESDRWPESWYPGWADRYSLNWFYRLMREPRRLWRRYSIEMAQFAWLAARTRFTRAGKGGGG